jgi:hypothetical protein
MFPVPIQGMDCFSTSKPIATKANRGIKIICVINSSY